MISVIIPAYNEEAMVGKAASVISKLLTDAEIPCELVFVDDGSKDKTWEILTDISAANKAVKGVHFSRNFGKEAAIMAGLAHAKGDCCVVIDCDLQHPPEKIIEMYRLWEQGYEIVEGQKSSRGTEGRLHTFAARSFYSIISAATGFDMANASDFKLLDRKAVNVLINMKEKNGFFRALSSWVGFKTTIVEFDVREREAGESKWSALSLTKYAVRNITSFSTAPMQLVTVIGALLLALSVILGVITLVRSCLNLVVGEMTAVMLLIVFLSSILMIALGIIGYYLAKIYEEIKGRPLYIVADTCGDK